MNSLVIPEEAKEKMRKRFWKGITKCQTDDCWIWTKSKSSSGYGCFRTIWPEATTAHRACYALEVGDVPKEMVVCHSCDTKLCVNPNHLWLGTQKENVADMIAKGRDSTRSGGRGGGAGEENASAKLTEAQVSRIRFLHKQGRSQRSIARCFNVSAMTINKIVRNLRWVKSKKSRML